MVKIFEALPWKSLLKQIDTKEPNDNKKHKVQNIEGRAESGQGLGERFSQVVMCELGFEE